MNLTIKCICGKELETESVSVYGVDDTNIHVNPCKCIDSRAQDDLTKANITINQQRETLEKLRTLIRDFEEGR